MKITSKPSIIFLNLFFLSITVLLLGCNKEEIEKVVSEIVKEEIKNPETENSNNNNNTSNDNTNDSTSQLEEKEIVSSIYDENGAIESTHNTRLQFEEGLLVKEIFPDQAASEEGKFITKEYRYNDKQLITDIIITDEFIETEDTTYLIEYNNDDVIIHIQENNPEGINIKYQKTNDNGNWEYVSENFEGQKATIGFDATLNWTLVQLKSASVTDTFSLFYANTYDTEVPGFYPNEPKYFGFLSWLTTIFNFLPSDGYFMTHSAIETQWAFWGSEEDFRNENYDNGDLSILEVENESINGALSKLTFFDKKTGKIVQTLELK